MGKFVNIHTHKSSNPNHIELVNHLVQDEWNSKTNKLYSAGFHPWHIEDFDNNKMVERVELLSKSNNVLAIGECGLDRAINTPIEKQEVVFLKQIAIAEKTQKPLIIHAVRSYPDLIRIKKQTRSTVPWIMHGFSGNKQTTEQLLPHGFYFSFGASILKDQIKLPESFKLIPVEKLFFETDESDTPIETIYIFAAQKLQQSVEELMETIFSNFKEVFTHG